MTNALFELKQNDMTTFALAEDFGELQELLHLLHRVNEAKERTPTLRESQWLLKFFDKEHGIRPLCTNQKLALIKPIDVNTFGDLHDDFFKTPCTTHHVLLDYDGDRFSFSRWEDGELSKTSGMLSAVIKAYNSSIRKLNASQFYIDSNVFEREMASTCTVEVTAQELKTDTFTQHQC